MDINAWLEDFTRDDTLREFFDDRRWDREIYTQKGFEDGIEQGIEQGISQEKINIAKKMLQKSKDINEIHEFTGLSLDILKEMQNIK